MGDLYLWTIQGYLFVVHKVVLNTVEIIMSNISFEREGHKYGVVVNTYHTDNVIFNAEEFMKYMFKSEQKINFGGTGDPQQNGVSEEEIKIVVNISKTIIPYSYLR